MDLIYVSSKSRIYHSGNKIYKFNCKKIKNNFDNELKIHNIIKQIDSDSIIKVSLVDKYIKMFEMDYYPYNLESYFAQKYSIDINEKQLFNIIYKVTNALKLLHVNMIIHGDFKAKNIMLDKDYNPIIIDFDLSINYDNYNINDLGSNNIKEEIDEGIKDDIKKLKFLVYQLLYKVEYNPKLYNNYNKIIKRIENEHSELANAFIESNIDGIISYFKKLI